MRVDVGAATDIGQVRDGNEDAYLVLDPLYAVADGMGGHLGGEVASNLALETIRERFGAGEGSLADHVGAANRMVFERSQRDRDVRGMGTTLTAIVVEDARARLVHVGDSRAYLFRDGELHRITKDHTVVAKMVEDGEISAAEAETHPHRNIVTRVLGVESSVEIDEGVLDVRAGDRVLLCSDGLTGMVADERIAAVLRDVADPQTAVDTLVHAANDAGGVDNITAVLLDFAEDGGSHPSAAVSQARPTVAPVSQGPIATPTASSAVLAPERTRVEVRHDRPPVTPRRSERRPSSRRVVVGVAIAVALLVAGFVGLRVFLDSQWYVGVSAGRVAIFRGVPTEVAGFDLHSVVVETEIPAAEATQLASYREELPDGITAHDRADAEAIVEQIRADVERATSEAPTRGGDGEGADADADGGGSDAA